MRVSRPVHDAHASLTKFRVDSVMGEYVTNHHAKALLGEVYCRSERYAKTASAVEPAQQLSSQVLNGVHGNYPPAPVPQALVPAIEVRRSPCTPPASP